MYYRSARSASPVSIRRLTPMVYDVPHSLEAPQREHLKTPRAKPPRAMAKFLMLNASPHPTDAARPPGVSASRVLHHS